MDAMFLQLKDKLTHQVLVFFMAEFAAFINAKPLVPVTMDPNDSFILTTAALITQNTNIVPAPSVEFVVADLYKSHWRLGLDLVIRFRDSVCVIQFAKRSRLFVQSSLNHGMHTMHYNFNQTQWDGGVVDYWMFIISAR